MRQGEPYPAASREDPPRIVIIAGEASGDRIAAGLIQKVSQYRPEVRFTGVAGPAMVAAGCHPLFPAERFSVVGLTEAIRRSPPIYRALRRLKAYLRTTLPDLLVCVDLPEINLRLAAYAHRHRIPVIYYVSPQIWAWRRGRMRTIKQTVDHMLVIFPFELALYQQAEVPVTYVGHPIMEQIPKPPDRHRACHELHLDPERPVVALFPGSRRSEVHRLAPVLLQAAQRLRDRFPTLQFVLPSASPTMAALLEDLLARMGPTEARVVSDSTLAAAAADCAAVASGTATVETMVVGTPLIILYRVSPLTYWLVRYWIKVPYIGMVNLIADREVAPELIQHRATSEQVATHLERLLTDPQARSRVQEELWEVRGQLSGNCSTRAAQVVLAYLREGS